MDDGNVAASGKKGVAFLYGVVFKQVSHPREVQKGYPATRPSSFIPCNGIKGEGLVTGQVTGY